MDVFHLDLMGVVRHAVDNAHKGTLTHRDSETNVPRLVLFRHREARAQL